jgi:hypothetical protein
LGHAVSIREMKNAILTENMKIKDHLRDIGVDRRIILKWILHI